MARSEVWVSGSDGKYNLNVALGNGASAIYPIDTLMARPSELSILDEIEGKSMAEVS